MEKVVQLLPGNIFTSKIKLQVDICSPKSETETTLAENDLRDIDNTRSEETKSLSLFYFIFNFSNVNSFSESGL